MAKTKLEKFNSVKNIGKEIDFEFKLTPQAEAILDNLSDYQVEYFKLWWKKHFGTIHGGHLHQYFQANDGINEAKKLEE